MWARRKFVLASAVIAPLHAIGAGAGAQSPLAGTLTDDADLIVYGASPSGIIAAVEAAHQV